MLSTTATAVRQAPTQSLFSANLLDLLGSAAAKYAGVHVHRQLVETEAYKAKRWTESLKRAFLDTDEDMRKGALFRSILFHNFLTISQSRCTKETLQVVLQWLRSSHMTGSFLW